LLDKPLKIKKCLQAAKTQVWRNITALSGRETTPGGLPGRQVRK
jgi:hypothetical protein